MLELYFVLYRIPKMMSQLARERNRSAVKWSLLGIAAWFGGEILVGGGFGLFYVLGMEFLGWPEEPPAGVMLLLYVAALAAAIGSFMIVRRVLQAKSAHALDPTNPLLQPPPPPPQF